MARYGDLDTQYFDDAGDPLVNGKIYFYETGTTTLKDTYADVDLMIPNTNPVILTAAGRQPNIFFDGVAKAILTTSTGTQILVRDPVGDTANSFGNPWIASKRYTSNDVVQGSDGQYYVSLINGNVNNNPVTTTGNWTFLYSVEWNAGTTYKLGSVVTYDTIVYQSLQNANLNKNPSTETSWWVPIQLVWSSTSTYAINANVVGTDGILYTSLQNSNTGNIPASSPSYWVGTSAAAASSASAAATSASNAASSASAASTSASNAATSESNAAASASTASTQATNASNYAAAASTSATNAANSASSASSSASSASASASAASTSASNAATSETNAAASASSASSSASTATTQASNAASSASAASTSASNASTSATNAANSASSASTSATNAASSASSASTSATNASNSASAAAASFDSFDDRYLGAKSSDPTVDNDGDPLLEGALYWNTGAKIMKVYDGANWTESYLPATGYVQKTGDTMTGVLTAPGFVGPLTDGDGNPRLAFDNGGAMGLAGANYGTAGQVPVSQGAGLPPVWGSVESLGAGGASASGSVVLTASSAAMQLITPTALGQSVTLPNATTLSEGIPIFNIKNVGPYEMLLLDGAGNRVGVIGAGGYAVCSLFDNSTAAGTWQISGIQYSAVFENFSVALARDATPSIQYLEIDTGKHLFVFVESATNRIYGVVYDETSNIAGAATLIRALPGSPGSQPVGIAKISASQMLLVSCAGANNSTAAEAVVLGISGTTITVNTPTGFTLSANAARIGSPVQVGTSFVLPYCRYGSPWQQAYRAMTVSGTTVTVGSETVAAGTADNTNFAPTVIPLSATTFFSIANDQSTELICLVGTISGTTVSTGAVSTLACADSVPAYHVRKLSTGRISVLWGNNSDLRGAILTISGTSISKSEISIGTKSGSGAAFTAVNIGDVFVAAWSSGASSNNGARALIDSGGTAQAGTLTTFPNSVASSGVQSIGQTETNLYLKIQNTTTSATFIRAYVSGSDLAYEELGQVAGAGVSFVGSVTNNRSVANERGPSVLVGQAAIGSPQGGALAMLIGGRAKPVYNEPSGFSSTFEQTSLNKGWFVIDGTTTTAFRRLEII